MRIKRTNFPSIINDNEEEYLNFLEAVINSIDIYGSVEVTHKPTGYLIRIAPSHPSYQEALFKYIKVFHNHLGIVVEFSKSIKSSSTITFIITNN